MPTKISQAAGAIIEKNGKILLVKEKQGEAKGQWNLPCGHIEINENPIDAAKREVEEESGFGFKPKNILGVYSLTKKERAGIHHVIKVIFIGDISKNHGEYMTEEIAEVKWFVPEEIENMDSATLRDVDIKKMIKDYFSGKKYPLDLITHTTQK